MNRKQFIIALAVLFVGGVALIVTESIFKYFGDNGWLYDLLIISFGYLFIKYKLTAPWQMFTNKFSMMVDYDLDVAGAVQMAEKAVANAPTKQFKTLYQVYLGIALYNAGRYEDAIKNFNTIELKKVITGYQVLIFAYTSYASFELDDMETVRQSIERIKNVKEKLGPKYADFVDGYTELLDAMQNLSDDPEHYKEIIERHFSREDGYISTKLILNYRLALYYKEIHDDLEMDKCLAFVIANGKEHHTALRAKELFKGSVNVDDYIYVEPQPGDVVDTQQGEPTEPELIEEKPEENEKPEDKEE